MSDPDRGLILTGAAEVYDSIERSDGYAAIQELFWDELGADAARSLDAPFTMGKVETAGGCIFGMTAKIATRSHG